jgi:hypothetical protein
LTEPPVYKETHGKRAEQWIEFQVDAFKSKIKISYLDYNCSLNEEILSLTKGDTVAIKMTVSYYYDWLQGNNVDIHGLIFQNKNLLNLNCRNYLNRRDNINGIYLWVTSAILSIVFLLIGRRPKIFNVMLDPSLIVIIASLIVILVIWKW